MREKNVMFSIIVPVYNVEKYIHKCVDSILEQTYKNFECILVDDGSTDGSSGIIDEYEKRDSRVKVIHKENGGLSSARNVGLSMARGEWILHIDSDDYIEKNTLEIIRNLITEKDNLEIIRFEYITEYPGGKTSTHFVDREGYYGLIDRNSSIKHVIDGCSFIVTGAYRNDVSRRASFREEIKRGADSVYALEITDTIKEELVISNAFYHYVQRMGSLARSEITPRQLTVLDSSKFTYDFISIKYPNYLPLALDSYVNTRVSLYYNMHTSKYEDEEFKSDMLKDTHEKYVELKKYRVLSIKKKLKYGLFDINPNIYCKVFELIVNMMRGEKYRMYKTKKYCWRKDL